MNNFLTLAKRPSALWFVGLNLVGMLGNNGFIAMIPVLIATALICNDYSSLAGHPQLKPSDAFILQLKIFLDSALTSIFILMPLLFALFALTTGLGWFTIFENAPEDEKARAAYFISFLLANLVLVGPTLVFLSYLTILFSCNLYVRGWTVRKPILFNTLRSLKTFLLRIFSAKTLWLIIPSGIALAFALIPYVIDGGHWSVGGIAANVMSSLLYSLSQVWLLQKLFGLKDQNLGVQLSGQQQGG